MMELEGRTGEEGEEFKTSGFYFSIGTLEGILSKIKGYYISRGFKVVGTSKFRGFYLENPKGRLILALIFDPLLDSVEELVSAIKQNISDVNIVQIWLPDGAEDYVYTSVSRSIKKKLLMSKVSLIPFTQAEIEWKPYPPEINIEIPKNTVQSEKEVIAKQTYTDKQAYTGIPTQESSLNLLLQKYSETIQELISRFESLERTLKRLEETLKQSHPQQTVRHVSEQAPLIPPAKVVRREITIEKISTADLPEASYPKVGNIDELNEVVKSNPWFSILREKKKRQN
ncbi:MAG TPA: hypothetical protein ENF42_04540 [Candidatus Bathyarchaeota archaeon]|nr:hypothetical protein [Candidatus Bathyarchaeota archaeon]